MTINKDFEDKCTCAKEDNEFHSCPYAEELNDDFSERCTCCEYCTNDCRMSI